MDAELFRQLKPMLQRYLKRFEDCFSRESTRGHLPAYVEGQLSDLPEKTVAPIAEHAGVAPRTLQEFLSFLRWDENRMRDRLEQIVASEHAGPHAIGLLDETSFVKKGEKTPGVKRQWCGTVGKEENCIVTVHLGYAREEFHCLLDGELYLPEDWAADRQRCREAGIPEDMTYRPKWQIGLELLDRAVANGVHFDWLTFDEGYGGKPGFLQALGDRHQDFIGEVPRSFTGWIERPPVARRPYHKARGPGRKSPRLRADSRKTRSVRWLLDHHPALCDQDWQRWRVKDGEKGPMLWEVKHCPFYPKADRLPLGEHHLVIARNVLDPKEIKFFVGKGPPGTGVGTWLLAAFSRWHVERCFQDGKGKVGLDHYEGRRYVGLKRHLAISAVSYLFLALVAQSWAEKKSGDHGFPGADRDRCDGPRLVAGQPRDGQAHKPDPRYHPRPAANGSQGPPQPHQTNSPKTPGIRHHTHRDPTLHLGHKLAL
jgi:SRSO17 transposase